MAKCFKCEKALTPALVCPDHDQEKETWDYPSGAVYFEGGDNFGSALYDSMVNGIKVEILICDDCLEQAKGTDKLREKDIWSKHGN